MAEKLEKDKLQEVLDKKIGFQNEIIEEIEECEKEEHSEEQHKMDQMIAFGRKRMLQDIKAEVERL